MTPTRTDEFTPLVAAAPQGDAREFPITAMPQSGHAQPFQSLGTRPAGVSSSKNGEPQLTVQRDGGRITHIRIQCNCGQTHEIACVYEEPQADPADKEDKVVQKAPAAKERKERKEK